MQGSADALLHLYPSPVALTVLLAGPATRLKTVVTECERPFGILTVVDILMARPCAAAGRIYAHAAGIRRRWCHHVGVLDGDGDVLRPHDRCAVRLPNGLGVAGVVLAPEHAVRIVAGVRNRGRCLGGGRGLRVCFAAAGHHDAARRRRPGDERAGHRRARGGEHAGDRCSRIKGRSGGRGARRGRATAREGRSSLAVLGEEHGAEDSLGEGEHRGTAGDR